MQIKKFEQSGFVVTADNGFKLGFDIGNKTSLESLTGVSVDAMLVSHIHGDHFHAENIVALKPKQVYLNQECIDALGEQVFDFEIKKAQVGDKIQIDCFEVEFFNVDHGPNVSAPLPENFGFLIHVDGQSIYFGGDIYNPSGIDVTNLSVDYALLPVGGHYTFGPVEAYDFAKTFAHIGQIIPMHYEKNNFIDPIKKDEFINLAQNDFKIYT